MKTYELLSLNDMINLIKIGKHSFAKRFTNIKMVFKSKLATYNKILSDRYLSHQLGRDFLYLAVTTRQITAFAVSSLYQTCKTRIVKIFYAAKIVQRCLKPTSCSLTY